MKQYLKLSAVIVFCSVFQFIQFTAKAQDTLAPKSKGSIADITLSPDQKYVCFTTFSKKVKVFEVTTGNLQYILEDAVSPVFSENGKYLVTISTPDEVKVWEVATGKLINDLKIETRGHVFGAAFSPTSKYVYAIAVPSSIIQSMEQFTMNEHAYTTVWETATGKLLHTYNKALYDFSKDENQIIYISKPYRVDFYHVDICNADSGNIRFSFESDGYFPRFSKDGKYILSFSRKNTEIWETATGKKVYTLDTKYCGFTGDGKYIVYGDNPESNISSYRIMEMSTFTLQNVSACTILSHDAPNKDYVVKSLREKENAIQIWKADSCELVQTIKGETLLAYSPDGKSILGLTGKAFGGKISLRNLATAELLYSLSPEKGKMTDGNFSTTGTFIITKSYENSFPVREDLSIWETASGKLLYSYRANAGEFTKDEKYLIVSEISDVKICEAYSGKVLYTLY